MTLSIVNFTKIFMPPFLQYFPDEEQAGKNMYYFFSKFVDQEAQISINSKIFRGWCGINTTIIPKLIYLAKNYEQTSKISKNDPILPKKLIGELFKITFEIYQQACKEKNMLIVPNLKGLETYIIKCNKEQKSNPNFSMQGI